MNADANFIDLKNACTIYSKSIQMALENLLNIKVNETSDSELVSELEKQEDLYFSVLFAGSVYGEFLIGLNKRTALAMMGIKATHVNELELYLQNRSDVHDLFKEVVNIAAGKALEQMKAVFPELSITPPKAIDGQLTLSSYQIAKTKLMHNNQGLSCYIYVDRMQLEIGVKQEELKRLNRAKSEFLANMSHELRTPLNGIIGMLDVLKNSNLNDSQKEQFEVIYQSGEFLLSLISDILEFSKIDSGKLEIDEKLFSLRSAIESVAESMATVILARNLEFNVYVDPEIQGEYLGDEMRLKQVLMNLIGNAIKFTPTGSISINAKITKENLIEVSIKDTGIGIPSDKLDSIFTSFTQVDASDNRKYGGAGLGLTISKSIVKAMNGEIRVQSQEAQGTEFIIRLPLMKSNKGSLEVHYPLSTLKSKKISIVSESKSLEKNLVDYLKYFHPEQENFVDGGKDIVFIEFKSWKKNQHIDCKNSYNIFILRPDEVQEFNEKIKFFEKERTYFIKLPILFKKLAEILTEQPCLGKQVEKINLNNKINSVRNKRQVLVVEDNKMNQMVIGTMLKQLGYDLEVAENGKQALEKFEKKNGYDFILMDCQMPIMNGYEATKVIRSLEEANKTHVPIIALTANAFRETKEACFECGMDDFATKPLKFEVLKEVVARTLNKFSNQ